MLTVRTSTLDIACEVDGPPDGPPLLLLHGWPDDVRGWRQVAPILQAQGWRTIAPYLRGFGPTRFLSPTTLRDGRGVALAQDALDLADALNLSTFAVAGHDWGARAAYTLAALYPARLTAIVGIALAYQPHGVFRLPSFSQARHFWYQWFLALDDAPDALRADPVEFARIQWQTWSPAGWFDPAEFEATAASFRNPDWVAVTLHGYRSRWRPEPTDSRYDGLQDTLASIDQLSTPTLMIQGGADTCDEPASSAGLDRFFAGPYHRLVLDGVGHFPPRETPRAVADAISQHCHKYAPFAA